MTTPQTRPRKLSHLARWMLLLGLVGWVTLFPLHGTQDAACGVRPASALTPGEQATPDSDLPGDDQPANERRTQLFDELGVRAWHDTGLHGRGIKVAILDTGFQGYRAHLGSALPSRVTTHSFRLDGNLEARDSQHGILCAEVIHTLAPEAELLLANWEEDRAEQFLAAVRWAKEQGARVISCSVIMPTWSDGEGHSVIHSSLARILGNGEKPADTLLFASAGNTAQRHWGGPFRDLGNGFHDWGTGQKENLITPWGSERVSVELCWQPGTNYELFIDDVTARRSVGGSTRLLGADRCCAAVRFTPQRGHAYTLRLRRLSGKDGTFHLVVLGGGLQHVTRRGSITFPGDGPEVIAVGAVNRTGHRLAYSSCGPNSSQPKPEFVASIPFPSQWRARPFTGTSAAAPQAAAVAALLWSRYPAWTASRVRDTLKTACTHLSPASHSFETGFGLIHLP